MRSYSCCCSGSLVLHLCFFKQGNKNVNFLPLGHMVALTQRCFSAVEITRRDKRGCTNKTIQNVTPETSRNCCGNPRLSLMSKNLSYNNFIQSYAAADVLTVGTSLKQDGVMVLYHLQ